MKTESAQKTGEKILIYAAAIATLPVIPIYILAYRLLGKQCAYHWPGTDVTPADQLSENQALFIRLFPILIILAVFVLLSLLLEQPLS